MEISKGITASLVNNPSIINMPQKNSAKMTSESESVLPMPKKFIKTFFFSAKWISLS